MFKKSITNKYTKLTLSFFVLSTYCFSTANIVNAQQQPQVQSTLNDNLKNSLNGLNKSTDIESNGNLFVTPNSINQNSKNSTDSDKSTLNNSTSESNSSIDTTKDNAENSNKTDSTGIRRAVIQELPTIPTVSKTAENIDKVKKYLKAGEILFNDREYDKALAKWQEAYGLSIEMKYPEGQGAALTDMCLVYLQKQSYVKAKYMGENAIEILAATPDLNALAKARVALSQAYFGLNNNVWGVQQLDAALKILTKDGSNSLETAKLMNMAGMLLFRYGKYKESLQFFRQGVTSYKQAGMDEEALSNQIAVINLMQYLGLYTAAGEEALGAMNLAKSLNKPNDILSAKSVYANCQYNLGNFGQATKIYKSILNSLKTSDESSIPTLKESKANIEMGLGCSLIALGQNEEAKIHLNNAIPVLKNAGQKSNEAQCMNALGVVYDRLGNYQESNSWFSQALELLTLISPPPPKLSVIFLLNEAISEYHIGSNRSAKIHIENAIEFLAKNKNDFLLGRCKLCLAQILFKLADNVKATKQLNECIDIATKINDDQTSWRAYLLASKIQLQQNQQDSAIDSLKSAVSFFRSPLSNIHASPESLYYIDSRNDMGFDLICELSKNNLKTESFLALEQLKSEKFLNYFLGANYKLKKDDNEVFDDLKTQRARLFAAENVSKPSELINEWKSWMVRFGTLKNQNPNLASMIAPIPLQYNQISKIAKQQNLFIVDYLVGPKSTLVFTLDGNSNQLEYTILNYGRMQIDALVKQTLYTIGQGANIEQQRQYLSSIYQNIFKTALNNNSSKTQNILILPDETLFNLPFAALVDNNNKFLIENYLVALSSSLQNLVIGAQNNSTGANTLFLQNASDRNDSDKLTSVFAPGICSTIDSSDLKSSELQSKLSLNSNFDILSKTCFNANEPLGTKLDGMLDGNPFELGNLVSFELSNDTFILSKGSIGENLLVGNILSTISRSLFYAGAKNQIMSLWFLPDNNRDLILSEFFRQKIQGQPSCKAYQNALKSAISNNPKPSHWSGFQFFGQFN